MATPSLDEATAKRVLHMVEVLFRKSNLLQNEFLLNAVVPSEDGMVSLAQICALKKMRGYLKLREFKREGIPEETLKAVADTLAKSASLKLSEDGKRVGGIGPLMKIELPVEQLEGRVVAASPLPYDVSRDALLAFFSLYGKVTSLRLPNHLASKKVLSGTALVEFSTGKEAERVLGQSLEFEGVQLELKPKKEFDKEQDKKLSEWRAADLRRYPDNKNNSRSQAGKKFDEARDKKFDDESMATPSLDEATAKRVLSQVEVLFGNSNFLRDKFLLNAVASSEDGMVSLAQICSLKKVRRYLKLGEAKPEEIPEDTLKAVADTLAKSASLKLSEDGKRVGRIGPQMKIELLLEQLDERIVAASPLPYDVNRDALMAFFSLYGDVTSVRLPNHLTSKKVLSGTALVEFSTSKEAEKVLGQSLEFEGVQLELKSKKEFDEEKDKKLAELKAANLRQNADNKNNLYTQAGKEFDKESDQKLAEWRAADLCRNPDNTNNSSPQAGKKFDEERDKKLPELRFANLRRSTDNKNNSRSLAEKEFDKERDKKSAEWRAADLRRNPDNTNNSSPQAGKKFDEERVKKLPELRFPNLRRNADNKNNSRSQAEKEFDKERDENLAQWRAADLHRNPDNKNNSSPQAGKKFDEERVKKLPELRFPDLRRNADNKNSSRSQAEKEFVKERDKKSAEWRAADLRRNPDNTNNSSPQAGKKFDEEFKKLPELRFPNLRRDADNKNNSRSQAEKEFDKERDKKSAEWRAADLRRNPDNTNNSSPQAGKKFDEEVKKLPELRFPNLRRDADNKNNSRSQAEKEFDKERDRKLAEWRAADLRRNPDNKNNSSPQAGKEFVEERDKKLTELRAADLRRNADNNDSSSPQAEQGYTKGLIVAFKLKSLLAGDEAKENANRDSAKDGDNGSKAAEGTPTTSVEKTTAEGQEKASKEDADNNKEEEVAAMNTEEVDNENDSRNKEMKTAEEEESNKESVEKDAKEGSNKIDLAACKNDKNVVLRQDLENVFSKFGALKFVDFKTGEDSGYVSFEKPGTAQTARAAAFLAKERGLVVKNFIVTLEPVYGEREAQYWTRIGVNQGGREGKFHHGGKHPRSPSDNDSERDGHRNKLQKVGA